MKPAILAFALGGMFFLAQGNWIMATLCAVALGLALVMEGM